MSDTKPKKRGSAAQPPKMATEEQKALLQWVQEAEPDELMQTLEELRRMAAMKIDRDAGNERDPETGFRVGPIVQGFDLLPPETQETLRQMQEGNEYIYNVAVDTVFGRFRTSDSGQNFINDSPVLKRMMNGAEKGEIQLGTNPETGEAAVFTLLGGYITPYEKEIIECVSKFKVDKQLTDKGKIWFTVGQLYRAMRHGKGTTSPTTEQRNALMSALTELSRPERKLTFKLNEYLKTWGGFETNGGRLRIIGFDELFGKIRGQDDILIILDDTPIICAVAENLHMWEPIPQSVKAIQQPRFTLSYIDGKKTVTRSFATNEARRKYCQKNGITAQRIVEHSEKMKPWALSESRIALRSVLLTFVYGYIRTRQNGGNHSNKLPYETIFERCGISEHHEARKRAKADIAVILDHLVNTVEGLQRWTLYTNKGSTEPDGVQISIAKLLDEGAQ